jgi:hypothetical protein
MEAFGKDKEDYRAIGTFPIAGGFFFFQTWKILVRLACNTFFIYIFATANFKISLIICD